MASSDGFHLTLPSDGSMETFPDNTLAHFKTSLPQPLDFTEGEWEVGLTEMLYPTFLENISKDEAFLDLLILFEPQTQKDIEGSNAFLISKLIMEEIGKVSAQVVQGQPVDPVELKKILDHKYFQISPFLLELIGKTTAQVAPTLVPWKDSYLSKEHIPLLGDRTRLHIYRVKFKEGSYHDVQGLINKINQGIESCMKKIFERLSQEKTVMKLEYNKETNRVNMSLKEKQYVTKSLLLYVFQPS